MTRHAIINAKTHKVVNVCIWEGAEWLPPKDHFVVKTDDGDIGDDWDEKANKFIKEPSFSDAELEKLNLK